MIHVMELLLSDNIYRAQKPEYTHTHAHTHTVRVCAHIFSCNCTHCDQQLSFTAPVAFK